MCNQFYSPAQPVRRFTLSDLLENLGSQASSLLPPGTCLHFFFAPRTQYSLFSVFLRSSIFIEFNLPLAQQVQNYVLYTAVGKHNSMRADEGRVCCTLSRDKNEARAEVGKAEKSLLSDLGPELRLGSEKEKEKVHR